MRPTFGGLKLRCIQRGLGAAVAVGALTMTAHAQWTIVYLQPSERHQSRAFAVQGSQQVGEAVIPGLYWNAGLWTGTAESWVALGGGANVSAAYGVYGGQQVGFTRSALRPRPPYPYSYYPARASLWTGSAGSRVDLHIESLGAEPGWSEAYGVYENRVVGEADLLGEAPDPFTQAIVWTISPGSWTWLSLHPLVQPFEANWSMANGVYGDEVVGEAEALRGEPLVYVRQACLWTYSEGAWSWLSLHPSAASTSSAHGVYYDDVHGWRQVGDAWLSVGGPEQECAVVWTGTADSCVNLSPAEATASAAMAAYNGLQVGSAQIDGAMRASLWNWTAPGVPWQWVNLHAFLPSNYTESYASGIWGDESHIYVVGWGRNNATGRDEALMWVKSSQPTGACCLWDGERLPNLSQAECLAQSGEWRGEDSTCDPNPCVPQGACCYADGSCAVSTQAACTGSWLGADIACDPNPCHQPGDLDCDGSVDASDIGPFVLALIDEAGYEAAYPDCNRMLADCSGDGSVNGLDIEVFIFLLIGGGPQAITVAGTANIFGAGHAEPPAPGGGGGGTLPVVYYLPSGTDRIVRFSNISGVVSCCGDPPTVGPEGIEASSDVGSWGGIAGIVHNNRRLFLAGVFLDDSEPMDPAPARLDCTLDDFLVLAAELRQTFFIGDGLTGTGEGEVQSFVAPPGATRLYLGFADALDFYGLPGWYHDNLGELTIGSISVEESPGGACCNGSTCAATESELACCARGTNYTWYKGQVCGSFSCPTAGMTILWDNYPCTQGPPTGATCSQYAANYPFWAQVADDFQLTAASTVKRVRWVGSYYGSGTNTITAFKVLIYDNAVDQPTGAGQPNPSVTAIYTGAIPIANVTVTANGDGTTTYEAALPTNFVTAAGTHYWIAIEAQLNFVPLWGISTSPLPGRLIQARTGFPILGIQFWNGGLTHNADMAFKLYGTTP